MDWPSLLEEMEVWLSSTEFDDSWRECYDRACRGSGRCDRNISESVLMDTATSVHSYLPAGRLSRMIPEPDAEFIRDALKDVGAENSRCGGFSDLEHFEAALVVVYTHLALCAQILEKQLPHLSASLTGKF